MDKTILIVSDLHLGAGEIMDGQKNPLEDFHSDEKFAEFLFWKANQTHGPLELLIMGDAFDFPQVFPDIGKACKEPELGTTENESLSRLEQIIQGHKVFFEALKEFLASGHNLRFLRGNHDIDLVWPKVQNRLRMEIDGGSNLIIEDDHIFRYKGLYCEHGNQYSAENAFSNPMQLIKTDSQGIDRLERCWGTYFVEEVYNDIETRFPTLENINGSSKKIPLCLMAIKSKNIKFTGKLIGRMFKIALKAGLPVTGWVSSLVMGDNAKDLSEDATLETNQILTVEDFLKNLRDSEISENLLRRYKDEPDFKNQLDSEINEVIQKQSGKEGYRLPPEDVNKTLGWITLTNLYQRAASKIIEKESGVQVVIFGHTHHPIDGNYDEVSDDLTGRYFNSGSWTSCVDMDDYRNQGKSFDELCISGIRKETNDFIEVTLTEDGNVFATLGSC